MEADPGGADNQKGGAWGSEADAPPVTDCFVDGLWWEYVPPPSCYWSGWRQPR